MTFWHTLPRPFFCMAPMADVTDPAWRALVAKRGKPDVMWTEFVSADGLYHTCEIEKVPETNNPLMRDLQFSENERSIVAQIFSSKPDMITYATGIIAELGFDGVDLNMGCPDRSIEKQGAGAALIRDPAHAVELIRAAQGAARGKLAVSVKTRVGYNSESLNEWLPTLLQAGPSAITLHLRTRREMSKVAADWDLMRKAVQIRNRTNPNVLLIGNGDVMNLEDARQKAVESGCDGVMLGRAMFGNPWLFSRSENNPECRRRNISLSEKLDALVELAHNFEKLQPPKHFAILKKHIKAFVAGFNGAAELRTRLMEANSAADLERIIRAHQL